MSTYLKPTLYNGRGLENQLKNLGFQAHDLICGCENPAKHLEAIFSTKQCHLSTVTEDRGDPVTDAVDLLENGDLERIFQEDVFEDDKR